MNEFQTSADPASSGDRGKTTLWASARNRGDRGRSGSRRSDRGATAVEYAIMVSLIAVVIVSAVALFGQNLIQLFDVPASAL